VEHFLKAVSIVQTLQMAGHTAYFAGGWVRDYIMERRSDDIDIATTASVAEIISLFPKTILVGAAFGVVVVVDNDHHFEVATFRSDSDYTDGRHPGAVARASPIEDSFRRDFTINGMFYDPIDKKLFDYVGGKEDIKKKIIRAIGDPSKRFREDRLRMLRAVRYATRLEFFIEKKTQEAIYEQAKDLFPSVSMERVTQEFKKMARFSSLDKNLLLLHQLQLLSVIFPSLQEVSTAEIEERVRFIPFLPKEAPFIVALAELFPRASQQTLCQLGDYLKLSRKEKDFLEFYRSFKEFFLSSQIGELIQWVDFYTQKDSLLVLEIFACHLSDAEKRLFWQGDRIRQERLALAIERRVAKNPVISSNDLMQAGVAVGKDFGKLLREAEKIAIEEQTDDKAFVMKKLKESLVWK
jgi:poly(A) polymerase